MWTTPYLPVLACNMAEILVLNTRELNTEDESVKKLITDERRKRAEKYLRESDRRTSYGVELLLDFAMLHRSEFPLNIIKDERGKPRLRDGGLHFSFSHSGDFALCAVSECEVGADIEQKRELSDSMCRRILSAEDSCGVIHAWSGKEAYLKLCGCGLFGGTSLLSLSIHDGFVFKNGEKAAHIFQTDFCDTVISLCTYEKNSVTVREMTVTEVLKNIMRP